MSVSQIFTTIIIKFSCESREKNGEQQFITLLFGGSTFSTDSHKKTPENCGRYPQILNGERWEVSTLKVRTRLQLSFGSLAVGIVIQPI